MAAPELTPIRPAEDLFAVTDPVPTQAVAPDVALPPETTPPQKHGILYALIILGFMLLVVGGVLLWKNRFSTSTDANSITNQNNQIIPELNVNLAPVTNTVPITPLVNQEPTSPDQDHDGLTLEEEAQFNTLDTDPDSDNDLLNDREEVTIYKTDPLNPDTDGDGYKDGEEVRNLYDPNGPGRLFNLNTIQH